MSSGYGNEGEEFCQKTLDEECLLWTGEERGSYVPILEWEREWGERLRERERERPPFQ